MNKVELDKHKEFYTFEKKEFNYFTQKMSNKKYRFYTGNILPPTYKDVLGLERGIIYKGELGYKQKVLPEETKVRFAENIALQKDILRIVKKRYEQFNYKCGIIKAKTGIGKTHLCMDIICYLQHTTLILVSNKKLLQEMMDKIDDFMNCSTSQYGDGEKDLGHITVMTKKSFVLDYKEIKDELDNFELVLIDECHQGFTKNFRDSFNTSFKNKDIFLYGLSATPSTNELDEKDLEKYYGKVIEVKKDYDFIPTFIFYNYQSKEEYEFEHYAELRGLLSEDDMRLAAQWHTIQSKLSKCSLILCDRIVEIEHWHNELNTSDDINIIKITGETKIEDDKGSLISALKNNKPTIIIGSIQKCSTGFDYPPIDTVFLFSAIKFENTVIQSIGRALRKSPGKTGATIHVWNDKILDKQRIQKQKAILEEYGIKLKDIQQHWINKEKKQRSQVVLTY